jgi:hypothetical protein
VLVLIALDITFTSYDLVAVANNERGDRWLVAQGVVTTPQAAVLDSAPFWSGDFPAAVVFFGLWTTQLSSFAIYGLVDPEVSTESLYGLSWAIGADLATTSYSVALATRGELAPPMIAVTELVTAAPQIAVASYALASPSAIRHERTAVVVLGAWSSAILVHGAASLIFRKDEPEEPDPGASRAWTLSPATLASGPLVVPGLVAAGRF